VDRVWLVTDIPLSPLLFTSFQDLWAALSPPLS